MLNNIKEDSLEVSKESVEKELECSEDTKKEGPEVSEKFVEKELECSEEVKVSFSKLFGGVFVSLFGDKFRF